MKLTLRILSSWPDYHSSFGRLTCIVRNITKISYLSLCLTDAYFFYGLIWFHVCALLLLAICARVLALYLHFKPNLLYLKKNKYPLGNNSAINLLFISQND